MRKIFFGVFLCFLAIGFYAFPSTPDIGSFPTQAKGEQESIRRIAQDVHFRPWKRVFRVSWKCAGGEAECGSMPYRETRYDSNSYVIGFEVDVGSGFAQFRQCRSKEELFAVAKKGGTLQDFSRLGSP